jgi:hypothetical protein
MRMPLLLVSALIALPMTPSVAQERKPLVTLESEIEAARKLMITERKLVIAGELVLSPEEKDVFWPVYNEYLEEMRAVGDDEVRLITEFAANYQKMPEDVADRLLREHLDLQARALKIRRNYVRRFKKVLPTIKVAKLYQVENKLDAVLDYQLASQIPMIGSGQ